MDTPKLSREKNIHASIFIFCHNISIAEIDTCRLTISEVNIVLSKQLVSVYVRADTTCYNLSEVVDAITVLFCK